MRKRILFIRSVSFGLRPHRNIHSLWVTEECLVINQSLFQWSSYLRIEQHCVCCSYRRMKNHIVCEFFTSLLFLVKSIVPMMTHHKHTHTHASSFSMHITQREPRCTHLICLVIVGSASNSVLTPYLSDAFDSIVFLD